MPVLRIFPNPSPPAFPDVTPERKSVPSLPPWLASVRDIDGEVAAAQIDPRRLPDLVAHLLRVRVGYWWPRERVRRRGPRGWKEWDRSLFAGTVFVGIGSYADRTTMDAAADYCRYFGWRLGWVRAGNGAGQNRLKSELASLEILLGRDPTLSARNVILPGERVRVIAGFYEGAEGTMIGAGPRATLQVSVQTLGQSVAVEIAREMVEAI